MKQTAYHRKNDSTRDLAVVQVEVGFLRLQRRSGLEKGWVVSLVHLLLEGEAVDLLQHLHHCCRRRMTVKLERREYKSVMGQGVEHLPSLLSG